MRVTRAQLVVGPHFFIYLDGLLNFFLRKFRVMIFLREIQFYVVIKNDFNAHLFSYYKSYIVETEAHSLISNS